MKLLLILASILILSIIGMIETQNADARCAGPYPCTAPLNFPLVRLYDDSASVIVEGTIVDKKYGTMALDGFDFTNPDNPCHVKNTHRTYPAVDLSLPFEERIYNKTSITQQGEFLEKSIHKAPFKVQLEIDKIYKGNVTKQVIDVFGIEINQSFDQFSHGYWFDPEIDERVLLYLHDPSDKTFGTTCNMSNTYQVISLQGNIWGWNEDDYLPDIYPGDIEIPQLKTQGPYQSNHLWVWNEMPACQLGHQSMARIHFGPPICVNYESVQELIDRGFAKLIVTDEYDNSEKKWIYEKGAKPNSKNTTKWYLGFHEYQTYNEPQITRNEDAIIKNIIISGIDKLDSQFDEAKKYLKINRNVSQEPFWEADLQTHGINDIPTYEVTISGTWSNDNSKSFEEIFQQIPILKHMTMPTTDGGKQCTDSTQCESHCKPVVADEDRESIINGSRCSLAFPTNLSCYASVGMCSDFHFQNCTHEFVNGTLYGSGCYPYSITDNMQHINLNYESAFILENNNRDNSEFSISISGIDVNANNNIYVADSRDNLIKVLDQDGNHKLTIDSSWLDNTEYFSPDAVATDADGKIYVLDNKVHVFDKTGDHLFSFGNSEEEDDRFFSARSLLVKDERIYVTDTYNHRIQVFNFTGGHLFSFGSEGTGDGEFNEPWDLSTNSEKQIFVADRHNHRIQVFNFTGGHLFSFGSEGTGDGEFNEPWGISVDPLDKIYVLDPYNQLIQVFGTPGTHIFSFETTGDDDSFFGIDIKATSDKIYVADENNSRIQVFDKKGNHLFFIGQKFHSKDGEFYEPKSIAVDDSGKFYVADMFNERLQVFDKTGNHLSTIDDETLGFDLGWVSEVAVTGDGRKVVFSGGLPQVIVMDTVENTWFMFEQYGPEEQSYQTSRSIDITDDGKKIFVTDGINNSIQVFDGDGNYLYSFGRNLEDSNIELLHPQDVSVTSDGSIVYVVDSQNFNIKVFNGTGEYLHMLDKNYWSPSGIDVSKDGSIIYVGDLANGVIQVFNTEENYFATLEGDTSSNNSLFRPVDVAVSNDGRMVYSIEDTIHRIQAFSVNATLISNDDE